MYNRLHRAGRLFQHWLTDAYACIEINNLSYLRVDTYAVFQDQLDSDIAVGDVGTKLTVLPSSYKKIPAFFFLFSCFFFEKKPQASCLQ